MTIDCRPPIRDFNKPIAPLTLEEAKNVKLYQKVWVQEYSKRPYYVYTYYGLCNSENCGDDYYFNLYLLSGETFHGGPGEVFMPTIWLVWDRYEGFLSGWRLWNLEPTYDEMVQYTPELFVRGEDGMWVWNNSYR